MFDDLDFVSKNNKPPKVGVGISIKDSGIYGAIVKKTEKSLVILKSSSRRLAFKPTLHHALNTSTEMVKALKEVASELGISRADIGIPTRHYYYRCIYVPVSPDNISKDGHFERKISSWIDDNVHLPNVPMHCEYDIAHENPDGSCEVAVGLVPKRVIEHYREICLRAGIFPVTIGSPLKDLHGACDFDEKDSSHALIDVEPAHSHISIYTKKNPVWNHTVHHDVDPKPDHLADAYTNLIKNWQEAVYESSINRQPLSAIFIHGTHDEILKTAKILNSLVGPETKIFSSKMETLIDPDYIHNLKPDDFDKFLSAIILAKRNLFLDL